MCDPAQKVFEHCIKKKNKNIQCQKNCMIFTIDASLLPLIHYVHISLCLNYDSSYRMKPLHTRVTSALQGIITVLTKTTGLHSLNTRLGGYTKSKRAVAAPDTRVMVTHHREKKQTGK